jgi:hypothetical protein
MDVESVCGHVIETVLWIPWGPIFILNWLRYGAGALLYNVLYSTVGWADFGTMTKVRQRYGVFYEKNRGKIAKTSFWIS